jgi:hypothetical protein
VAHPVPPLPGREFVLLAHRHNRGEDRAFFIEDRHPFVSLPAQWTGLAPPDPFVIVAVVCAAVAVADLLELARLLERLRRADAVSPGAAQVFRGFCRRCPGDPARSGLARVGPTTPTRARRFADASVDPTLTRASRPSDASVDHTEARKDAGHDHAA